jgi:uncharacterized protein YcnI
MMKKYMTVLTAGFLSMILFAGIASAHVVVYPQATTQGSYEKFTVRVPTEKDVPTVKVEVKVPDNVDVSRVEPIPGWKYQFTKDPSGKINSITWTASGDGLSSTEFGEFNMQGKVSDQADSLVWKAYQTYKDGSVVEWVGAKDSDKPASVTVVKPKSASGTETQQTGSSSSLPLYLSIAALVVGVLSLIVSMKRKRA